MPKIIKPTIIKTDQELAGNGKDDPYRRLEQYFSEDGILLLQYDPIEDEAYGAYNMVEFLRNL